jgi:alkylation response protein AidB-like acyl-CoA dehydrogenase
MLADMVDRTMQFFGSAGYCTDRPVERIWRDLRTIPILGGTSEILRNVVAQRLLASGRR